MRIGIDLGGTKTEIICLHEDNGKELYRQRVPTPKDYKKTIDNVTSMVLLAEKTLGNKGTVGIGIPGTISKVTQRVKNANSTWLNDKPLSQDLEKAMKREVRIENDANCFALSEATDGAGAGYDVVFGVIIGTGCGAGISVHQKPLSGINGIAGEWGHNPLPFPVICFDNPKNSYDVFDEGQDKSDIINALYKDNGQPSYDTPHMALSEYPGPQCYCGKRGCLETWISGTGFKNDYKRVTGNALSTHDIITLAHKGDEMATAALERYADRLARGLSGVINILDPDVIVLGGGMSNVHELYSLVPKTWKKYIFSNTIETIIKPPLHGDSSGVIGAAWLCHK